MKVKNQPKPQEIKEYERKCVECSTEFIYDKNDIQKDKYGHWVECPGCKTKINPYSN